MERIQKLIRQPAFTEAARAIQEAEIQRIWCRHGIDHSLDVARIAQIINLEQELGLSKELIYAAALVHDLGRADEYKTGLPHEQGSARLAPVLLEAAGFTEEEIKQIADAILTHRGAGQPQTPLGRLLQKADKLSRNCLFCPSAETCHWSDEKKNKEILY